MVQAPNFREILWPKHASYSRLFSSLVLVHTRKGFFSLAAWASRSSSISMQLEFLEGNVSGYVFATGNEMLHLYATLLASLPVLASFLEADAGSTARAFKLPGRYVTPPVTSRPSIWLITHLIQSVITLKAYP